MPAQATSRETDQWVRAAVYRFEGPLILYATRLLGDSEGARDVVQDTFLKLCGQSRGEVEGHLAEWLFTVCRNRALDVIRKEGRMARLGEEQAESRPSPAPGPAEQVEHRDEADRVLGLLDSLPVNQREVIRLRFQNGFSYKEISSITGHSVTNVGYLMHVGMKTLRGWLAEPQVAFQPEAQS
jgi:RNA polymerase sigma-70 factor (ECF subfamily)